MKGKQGAAAANRRLDVAVRRVQELERCIQDLRHQHRVELDEVRVQLVQAQGRLVHDVRQLSDAAIREARAEANQRVAEAQEQHRAQVLDALKFLTDKGVFELKMPDWPTFAEKIGVRVGEIMFTGNRNARRMTTRGAREHEDLRRQADI